MVLHPEAIVAGYLVKCFGNGCFLFTSFVGTGHVLDTFATYVKPEGGFCSAPFLNSVRLLGVSIGTISPNSVLLNNPEYPESMLNTSCVRSEETFYIKKEGVIYLGEKGLFINCYAVEPIYFKKLSTGPPDLLGYKVPSLGLTVTESNCILNGINSDLTEVKRDPVPSVFANVKSSVFKSLNDEDLLRLLNNENLVVRESSSPLIVVDPITTSETAAGDKGLLRENVALRFKIRELEDLLDKNNL